MSTPPALDKANTPVSYDLVVRFLISYGTKYLACGGPIPRLERFMERGAQKYGYSTQVYATPTVLLMSCAEHNPLSPSTFITRVEEQKLNFAELKRLDKMLRRFSKGKANLERAQLLLDKNYYARNSYPIALQYFASFSIGFFASFAYSGRIVSALISGLLCFATHSMAQKLRERFGIKGFYFEFLASLGVILSSALISPLVCEASIGMAFGSFIYLVPGLKITTSISEIVSESIISGILRLFKALLTLVAMGLAYVMSFDIAHLLNWTEAVPALQQMNSPFHFFLQETCHLATLLGFTIYFQVPRKFLPHTLLTGFLGSLIFHIFLQHNVIILPAFLSAFGMGLLSLTFGHFYKIPSQIFSTPSILILVPGMLAFSTFESVLSPDPSQRGSIVFQTLLTATAIVFGLITARIPFLRIRKTAIEPRAIFDDFNV